MTMFSDLGDHLVSEEWGDAGFVPKRFFAGKKNIRKNKIQNEAAEN